MILFFSWPKLLIHPKQVEVVNELFTVDSAERDQAAPHFFASSSFFGGGPQSTTLRLGHS